MRKIIPKEIVELLDKFSPYLYCPEGSTGLYLRDDAPEEAREAYEKYMNLPPETEPDPRYI